MATMPESFTRPTVDAIYAAYEARAESGFRRHLGGSIIGTECHRSLWYSLRWASVAKFPGRVLRLFQTGHLAEPRFFADLRAIGVTVMDTDPATGRQWELRDESGHMGGSMDGVGLGFREAPATWHGIETKTMSEKNFKAMEKDGVQKSKPLHYAQMQIYMAWSGLTRFFYLTVNKNTDALYQERVRVDVAEGLRLQEKGLRIVNAPRPPGRISTTPDWFECRFCNHAAVCWEFKPPARHCRSCLHSTPVAGGRWHCERHNEIIPESFEISGCSNHCFIPDFIDGTVIETNSDLGVIRYRMRNGAEWLDGLPY